MKTTTRAVTAAMFALALPLVASAQGTPAPATPTATPPASAAPASMSPAKLAIGKWTGAVSPPGSDALDIEFAVAPAGDSLKIDMTILAMGEAIPLSNIKVEPTKVSFSFSIQGMDIKCALNKKDDGSYAGDCGDGSGTGAPMTMVPPKKGTN